jgi:ABC-type phosphate transport system substrate-binding protein
MSALLTKAMGLLLLVTLAAWALGANPASAADSHALIQGSGSSWAANAINQWVADVNSQGIQVVYTPDGDSQGRQDFANKTSDFAVTSLGYQGVDPVTGVSDTSEGRHYVYLPIAAGGTAFPYHIVIDGQQVKNLRLSGETIAKIFTNQITNWDDPEITADNDGNKLPSLPIVPVVQSEGSGATAQLTRYFATEYGSIWQTYSHTSSLTEYYPRQGAQIAQNGSNGAMNYIASGAANGSIGYVEYSYALSANYPVVKVLNAAGYYALPTQYNDAVALEAAQINMDQSSPDYLLQNLDDVYTDSDPRTYPLSSYVYAIEPTGTTAQDSSLTGTTGTAKRQSIADFLYYSICQGQREIGPIGYSPLPVNLVEAGFGQIAKLQAADPGVDLSNRDISTCGNPTFVASDPSENYLAQIAPMPLACDKIGAEPCAAGTGNPESLAGYSGTGTAAGGAGSSGSSGSSGLSGLKSESALSEAKSLKGKWRLDKATGQLIPPNGLSKGGISAAELSVTSGSTDGALWAAGAAVLLALAVFLPALYGRRSSRRRREGDGS